MASSFWIFHDLFFPSFSEPCLKRLLGVQEDLTWPCVRLWIGAILSPLVFGWLYPIPGGWAPLFDWWDCDPLFISLTRMWWPPSADSAFTGLSLPETAPTPGAAASPFPTLPLPPPRLRCEDTCCLLWPRVNLTGVQICVCAIQGPWEDFKYKIDPLCGWRWVHIVRGWVTTSAH